MDILDEGELFDSEKYSAFMKEKIEWIAEHPGSVTLTIGAAAFIINFLYYVFICGTVVRFGIGFERVTPLSQEPLFSLLLYFTFASIVLLTNSMSYNKILRLKTMPELVRASLFYYLYSAFITVLVFLVTYISEMSAEGIPEFSSLLSWLSFDLIVYLAAVAGLVCIALYFFGFVLAVSKRIGERSQKKRSQAKHRSKKESKSEQKRLSDWLFNNGKLILGSVIFVVVYCFVFGLYISINQSYYRLVYETDNTEMQYLVVYEDGDRYCLERCAESEDEETLTVYTAYQKWVSINEVATTRIEVKNLAFNSGEIPE